MMEIHALLILAMQQPTNAYTLELNAQITTFAPSTNVWKEDATFLKRKTVTTTIHALSTLATLNSDANTLQKIALITMSALLILATQKLDASTPKKFVMTETHAPSTLATEKKDAFSPQNTFATETNVLEKLAAS